MNNYITTEKLAYSIEELATLSTLSAPKIRKDIRNGKLQSMKKGSRRIILRDDAIRYLSTTDSELEDQKDISTSEIMAIG
ncbi:MAG TPA: helix-turn-helix domain-containing protein [Pyrinomonadaceae bacterium]|nr:helix-turn-helix domain-containing protein [Pyrinomonadaceae bacterium]